VIQLNAAQLKAKVQGILNNREGALKAAGLVLLAKAQEAIEQSGPGWAPFKRPPKRPHQLLWDTGTLIQSLSLSGANNVFTVSGNSVTVGTNVAYAAAQNEGTRRGVPARPYLFIDAERQDAANAAYVKRLLQAV
jgi:phage gpG-like protein